MIGITDLGSLVLQKGIQGYVHQIRDRARALPYRFPFTAGDRREHFSAAFAPRLGGCARPDLHTAEQRNGHLQPTGDDDTATHDRDGLNGLRTMCLGDEPRGDGGQSVADGAADPLLPTTARFGRLYLVTITWNTGQTSTLTLNRVTNVAGAVITVTQTGTVTGGLFSGDTVVMTATAPSTDVLNCTLGLGTVSSTYSTVVLEITSA